MLRQTGIRHAPTPKHHSWLLVRSCCLGKPEGKTNLLSQPNDVDRDKNIAVQCEIFQAQEHTVSSTLVDTVRRTALNLIQLSLHSKHTHINGFVLCNYIFRGWIFRQVKHIASAERQWRALFNVAAIFTFHCGYFVKLHKTCYRARVCVFADHMRC